MPYIGEALQEILALKKGQVKTVNRKLKNVLERTRKI